MTFFPRLMEGIYGGLLRLYPRKFQQEFGEEMQGVFACGVKEALRTGTLALLQVLFFEMLDFPVNLAIEHVSQWRKVWSMKDTRHGIGPFRSAAMGAVGLLIGYLIVLWVSKVLVLPGWWYKVNFGILLPLRDMIPGALTSALASALLGLMLCLSVSASVRLTLRTCLAMAGLELVATMVGAAIVNFAPYQRFFNQFYDGSWQGVAFALNAAILAMIDGLFTGAGLGLATGGWKSAWRFALKGLLAYGLGFFIGENIYELCVASGWWIGITTYPVFVLTFCICGILAGAILGWLWGKQSGHESLRIVEASPAS
jgi:hypothetical protein